MSQHCHVDLAQVEAEIAKAIEALKPLAERNDSMGAQARMAMSVDTAFSRQMSTEINRGTSVDDVSDALAAICANMIMTLLDSTVGEVPPHEMVPYVNGQLAKTANFLMQRFAGNTKEVYSGFVELQRGGRA